MDGPRPTYPAHLRDLDAARVLEMTTDIAIVADLEGVIVYGNAALEERVGQPLSELIGRHASEVVHPADLDPEGHGWNDFIAGKCDQLELALRFGSPATGWR